MGKNDNDNDNNYMRIMNVHVLLLLLLLSEYIRQTRALVYAHLPIIELPSISSQ